MSQAKRSVYIQIVSEGVSPGHGTNEIECEWFENHRAA